MCVVGDDERMMAVRKIGANAKSFGVTKKQNMKKVRRNSPTGSFRSFRSVESELKIATIMRR